jgi:hypothetical protein
LGYVMPLMHVVRMLSWPRDRSARPESVDNPASVRRLWISIN